MFVCRVQVTLLIVINGSHKLKHYVVQLSVNHNSHCTYPIQDSGMVGAALLLSPSLYFEVAPFLLSLVYIPLNNVNNQIYRCYSTPYFSQTATNGTLQNRR